MCGVGITIVQFSDGDHSMYFLNGIRDESIHDDSQLLDSLAEKTINYVERIWITPIDDKNPEPWEDLWYTKTKNQLFKKLQAHPELEER